MNTDGARRLTPPAEKRDIGAFGCVVHIVASARLAKLEKTFAAELLRWSTRKMAYSFIGAEQSKSDYNRCRKLFVHNLDS